MSFELKYNQFIDYFNNTYKEVVSNLDVNAPQIIKDAMIYASSGGGKRIRPILCYSACDILGVSLEKVKEFAIAIELIHSYSLVHDDLPCMDNDDYRHGKLSTHKKYGYAYGVLTGDALLNFAFELCLSRPNFDCYDVKALKILSEFAGYSGMIGGQVLDLQNEKNAVIDQSVLYEIYINKTSKLIMAPLVIASALAGDKYFDEFERFGKNLGILFQITDDILDQESSLEILGKTPQKDNNADKFTAIKVFGLGGAKNKASEHYNVCKDVLAKIPNSEFLVEFLDNIYYRKK